MNTDSVVKTRPAISNPLVCPHCGTGQECKVVGLFWDRDEISWRCLMCGHRSFERPRRTDAQITADLLWEKLLGTLDAEPNPDGEEDPDADALDAYCRGHWSATVARLAMGPDPPGGARSDELLSADYCTAKEVQGRRARDVAFAGGADRG